MTVRFRPVEANEQVDNERTALYMGSAITMEQGKLARSQAPCICSYLQYTPVAPPTSVLGHTLSNSQPRSFRPQLPALDLLPSSAGRSQQAPPLQCLKRPFLFLILLSPYHSTKNAAASGRSVTLGIRLCCFTCTITGVPGQPAHYTVPRRHSRRASNHLQWFVADC
jgi:hypothetical protein